MAGVNPWIVDPNGPDAERTLTLTVPGIGPDGGDLTLWVRVKSQLSIGQQRKMLKNIQTISQPVASIGAKQDATATFEWTDYSFARMGAYINDWSLAHDQETAHRLPATRASYEALSEEVFKVIDVALDAHEKAMADEKKARRSESRLKVISA